jgi:hypothetical protein
MNPAHAGGRKEDLWLETPVGGTSKEEAKILGYKLDTDGIFKKIETGNSFEAAKASFILMDIINQIQEIRTRNNQNWMDLARLAFEVAPDRAKEIMKRITECDSEILNLSKELSK